MRQKGAAGFGLTHWRTVARTFSLISALTGALACSWVPSARAELDDLRFRGTVDRTWDDNVSRAEGVDKFEDWFTGINVNASLPWQIGERTRLVLNANAGGEIFDEFKGLDRTYANLQGEFQFRGSGEFGAPIWGVFLRQGADWYKSTLRDGYRGSFGLSVRKPWTDRIFVFGALASNLRDGRSKVFDTEEISLRGNLDYSLPARQTVYLGLELRKGDIVSTARPELKYFDIADALILDDVFTDTTRFSYRLKALTTLFTLGYNVGLGERASVDLAYRYVYSTPDEQPPSNVSPDKIYYVDNQIMASLLLRF
ncbi:MAG: hypothetical protein ACKVP2_18460 [Burkholderiales bacterium]